MLPRVSVITPTRNRSALLREALESVYAQRGIGKTFDLEVIVVDDASTDSTQEVARGFPLARYIRTRESRGVSAARNAGIRAVTGEFVGFLDDDDVWRPSKLELQVPVLEAHPQAEVVYSQYEILRGSRSEIWPSASHPPSGQIFLPLLMDTRALILACSVLVRRSAIERAGHFDESLSRNEDHDMWLRLAFGGEVLFVPGCVAVYRPARDGLVHTGMQTREMERTKYRVIRKALRMLPNRPEFAEVRREAWARTALGFAGRFAQNAEFERYPLIVQAWLRKVPRLINDKRIRDAVASSMYHVARKSHTPLDSVTRFCFPLVTATGFWTQQGSRLFLGEIWKATAVAVGTGRERHRRSLAGYAALLAILFDPKQLIQEDDMVNEYGGVLAASSRESLRWYIARAALKDPRHLYSAIRSYRLFLRS